MSIRGFFATFAILLASFSSAFAGKTENVVIVTWDGLRWQEFFGGANQAMMNS